MLKQIDERFKYIEEPIYTDGCLFMFLLSIGDYRRQVTKGLYEEMTFEEVISAYHYAIPDYMEDHRNPGKDRCYIPSIKAHEEIIKIGLRIMGFRKFIVKYRYRKDEDKLIIGSEDDLRACNYFCKKVPYKSSGHFVGCRSNGDTTYNPGNTDNRSWLSFRGYEVITY